MKWGLNPPVRWGLDGGWGRGDLRSFWTLTIRYYQVTDCFYTWAEQE